MIRSRLFVMGVLLGVACTLSASAPSFAGDALKWKQDAQGHISRIQALAVTTSFGSINVSVPKQFRQWMPVNDAARVAVGGEVAKGVTPPPGEVPVFIQFTRFGIKGLRIANRSGPFEWAADADTAPALKTLGPHWLFPEIVNIDQFRTAFTIRIGDDKGILPGPRFDLEVRIKDARVPVDIHALQKTCLQSNPPARRKDFVPGKITVESKNVPLPSKVQRWLSESFMKDYGETIVTELPKALFGLPTVDAVAGGQSP